MTYKQALRSLMWLLFTILIMSLLLTWFNETIISRSGASQVLHKAGKMVVENDTLHFTPSSRVFTERQLLALKSESNYYTIVIHATW